MNPSGIRALGPGRARGAWTYNGGLLFINKALNEPDFDPLMVLLDQIFSEHWTGTAADQVWRAWSAPEPYRRRRLPVLPQPNPPCPPIKLLRVSERAEGKDRRRRHVRRIHFD
jgi:hypothetical protein